MSVWVGWSPTHTLLKSKQIQPLCRCWDLKCDYAPCYKTWRIKATSSYAPAAWQVRSGVSLPGVFCILYYFPLYTLLLRSEIWGHLKPKTSIHWPNYCSVSLLFQLHQLWVVSRSFSHLILLSLLHCYHGSCASLNLVLSYHCLQDMDSGLGAARGCLGAFPSLNTLA